MRARFVFFFSVIALASLPCPSPARADGPAPATTPAPAPAAADGRPRVHRLPNGLTLVAVEDHANPVIALSAFVTTGSRTEEGKWSGSLHYVEHLVYKGNTKNYKPTEFRKRIAEIGAEAGGWTWNDEINFGFEAPRENFRQALSLFTESLCGLIFEPKWFEDEKQVVIQELEKYEEQPDHLLGSAWDRLAWSRHPYGQDVGGTIPNIRNLDQNETERYYRERFTPNHFVLCVAGDFTEKELLDWIRAEWDGFKPGPASFELGIVEPVQTEARESTLRSKFANLARFTVGFRTVPGSHADTPALLVLTELLNSPTVGLPRYLVTDHKWVRWVSASHVVLRDDGALEVTAELDAARARTVLDWTRRKLLGLSAKDLEERTIDVARRRLLMARAIARETCAERAERLGFEFERMGESMALSLDDRIRAVGRADLERVLAAYARPEKLVSVLLLPAEAKEPEADPKGIDESPRREPEPPKLEVLGWPNQPRVPPRAQPPAASAPSALSDAPGPSVVDAPNGVRGVVMPRRGASLVSVCVRVLGGQWVEPQGQAGINRLTTRLLLRGTRGMSATELDALECQLALDVRIDHDAGSRANTARNVDYRDAASLEFRTLPETLPAALALVRELLFFPRFDPEEFAKVKADTLDEIRTLPEDRLEFIKQEFYDRAYAGHPYGRPTIGTAAEIERLTLDQVKAFHRRVFRPERVVVAVAGPVEPSSIGSLLSDGWKGIAADPASPAAPIDLSAGSPGTASAATAAADGKAPRQVIEAGANQWTVNFGRPCLACGDPGLPAARLLFRTLGNRHFFKYVYEEGVSYRSWFKLWEHLGASPWIVENDLDKAKFDPMLESIEKDIASYAAGALTDDEIERTRRRVLSGTILARQRGLENAWFVAVAEGNRRVGRGRGLEEYDRYLEELRAVSPDTVRALARELLTKPYLRLIVK